jgi:hypothetical protein
MRGSQLNRVQKWTANIDERGTGSIPPTPSVNRTTSFAGTVAPDDSVSTVSFHTAVPVSGTTKGAKGNEKAEKPQGMSRIAQKHIEKPYSFITADQTFAVALTRIIYYEMPFFSDNLDKGVPQRVAVAWSEACGRLGVDADLWRDHLAAENARRLVMSPFLDTTVPLSDRSKIRRNASGVLNTLRSTLHGFLRKHFKLQQTDDLYRQPHEVKAFVKSQLDDDAFMYLVPTACSHTTVPCSRKLTRSRN